MPEDNTNAIQQPEVPVDQVAPAAVPVNPYFSASAPSPVATTPPQPLSTPSPIPTTPSPMKLPGSSKKKKLLLFGAIAVGVLALGGGLFWFLGQGTESALAKSFRENSAYDYRPVQENVDPSKVFTFKNDLTPTDGGSDFGLYEVTNYVNIYSDAALTKPARANVFGTPHKEIMVKPPAYSEATDPVAGESVRISNDGEWGLYDMYYIAQFVDLKTGKKLEKPIVTPFSTKKDVPTPVVQFKITEDGNTRFSWAPVEGATQYYIVALDKNNFKGEGQIIGQTDGTEWTSSDIDKYGEKQNAIFQDGYTDDELLDERTKARAEAEAIQGVVTADYGVIAVVDDRFSALSPLDTSSLKQQLPYTVASNTAEKMNLKMNDIMIESLSDVPVYIPVAMADNSVVLKSVIIDTVKTQKSNSIIIVGQGRQTTIKVVYTIEGTALTGYYHVRTFNEATYVEDIAKIAQRNLDARGKTGQVEAGTLPERPDLTNVKASTTKPSVPYKINASNPLTEYLAANMLNGEKYIDVTAFISASNPVSPTDAFEEATAQNPYILLQVSGNWTYDSTKHIFIIDYDESRDDMIKEQKKIDDEVKRVIASIIKSGMSDREKVQAINKYVIDTTEYTFDAIIASDNSTVRNAWTPSGVLFDKKAVCGGYAEAFKVLADAAGLESVYVTGNVNSSAHAWNKVKVDGKWRVVDTTWNDSTPINAYLLITDAELSKLRTNKETKEWMADAVIGRYAAI